MKGEIYFRKEKLSEVENVYGASFKYQELFNKLIKLQNQRRVSEEKAEARYRNVSQVVGNEQFFSANKHRRPMSNMKLKTVSINLYDAKKITARKSVCKKIKPAFRSFSPSQAKRVFNESMNKTKVTLKKVKKPINTIKS